MFTCIQWGASSFAPRIYSSRQDEYYVLVPGYLPPELGCRSSGGMDGTCSLVALQHKVWIFNAGKILLDYDLSSCRAVQEYFRARSISHWEDLIVY